MQLLCRLLVVPLFRFTLHGDPTELSFELFRGGEDTVKLCALCSSGLAVVSESPDGLRHLDVVNSFQSPPVRVSDIPRSCSIAVLDKMVLPATARSCIAVASGAPTLVRFVAQLNESGDMEVLLGTTDATLYSYSSSRGLQDELLSVRRCCLLYLRRVFGLFGLIVIPGPPRFAL